MAHYTDQVTAEICMELQIAVTKAILCNKRKDYVTADRHLRSCNPFFKAFERADRITDLDQFVDSERVPARY